MKPAKKKEAALKKERSACNISCHLGKSVVLLAGQLAPWQVSSHFAQSSVSLLSLWVEIRMRQCAKKCGLPPKDSDAKLDRSFSFYRFWFAMKAFLVTISLLLLTTMSEACGDSNIIVWQFY